MYTITKSFTFAAAHHLTCVPEGHKCRRPHGHTYTVTVELAAAALTNNMVVDYTELAALAVMLKDNFDHRDLNEEFDLEPTAENLAVLIHGWCHAKWPQTTAVRVSESPTSSAEYRP